jgi:hypothetical protein
MLAISVLLSQKLSHRTLVDRLNRPNLQEVRTVQGAKGSDQLLQEHQPGQQMQPPLPRSLGEPRRRTTSSASRQRVASMTLRTTAVSTEGKSLAGTTVQQAEMPIKRASQSCAVVT